jgi:hypothetical protein
MLSNGLWSQEGSPLDFPKPPINLALTIGSVPIGHYSVPKAGEYSLATWTNLQGKHHVFLACSFILGRNFANLDTPLLYNINTEVNIIVKLQTKVQLKIPRARLQLRYSLDILKSDNISKQHVLRRQDHDP